MNTYLKQSQTVVCEVLSLIGQLMAAKSNKNTIESWLTLKSYGLSENCNAQTHSLVPEKIEAEKTMSIKGSLMCIQKIEGQSTSVSLEKHDFEDKVIEKILFLEGMVNHMRRQMKQKQSHLELLSERPVRNCQKKRMSSCKIGTQGKSPINYLLHSPIRQYSLHPKDQISMTSETLSKTIILGQMFDDETESIKDMIHAVKTRTPGKLVAAGQRRRNHHMNLNSPRGSEGFFEGNQDQKQTANLYACNDDDTMSAPGLRNQESYLTDIPNCEGITQSNTMLIGNNQESRYSMKIRINSAAEYSERNFSFEGSKVKNSLSNIPKPDFRRRNQFGVCNVEKSPQPQNFVDSKTQRVLKMSLPRQK